MSVNANTIIDEAARALRDPKKSQRVDSTTWLEIFNRTCRDICTRRKVLEFEAFDDVVLDDRYPYPERLVKARWLRYSGTPTDLATFDFLKEVTNEDKWRRIIESGPVGEPARYFARQGFLQLDVTPATFVAQGLWIAYWGIPVEVATPANQNMPLPDFFRDHVRDGMVIEAKTILGAQVEAERDKRQWLEREMFLADAMEDRSEDERGGFVPASYTSAFEDQV